MSKALKWLEDESDRLEEECHSNPDPYKSINNSFLEGFNYALANVEALEQPQLDENQQEYLDWLKREWGTNRSFLIQFIATVSRKSSFYAVRLSNAELATIWNIFFEWVREQEEE